MTIRGSSTSKEIKQGISEIDGELTREISDKKELEGILKAVSSWAGSDLSSFAEDITIKQAVEYRCYRVGLSSQYQVRYLVKRQAPHDHSKVGKKTIDIDVDIWAHDKPVPEFEVVQESTDLLKASREVATCDECVGDGDVTCYSCEGRSAGPVQGVEGRAQTTATRVVGEEKKRAVDATEVGRRNVVNAIRAGRSVQLAPT
jgi:hypothetical protein